MKRIALTTVLIWASLPAQTVSPVLPGTRPLDLPADWRDQQLTQILNYYQGRIDRSAAQREGSWKSVALEVHRQHLRSLLGLLDHAAREARSRVLTQTGPVRVEDLSIRIDGEFSTRALLFIPQPAVHQRAVITVPPETETPEAFAGVTDGSELAQWLAGLLARHVIVAIPDTIARSTDYELGQKLRLDRRRLLHRLGWIVGRSLTGLEVDESLALRDYLATRPEIDSKRISIAGSGQGGMTALYAAAVDSRFLSAGVVDYLDRREQIWQEPVDRMLWGQLNEFGDAEIEALISPRLLIVGKPITEAAVALVHMPAAKEPVQLTWRTSAQGAEEARNLHFNALLEYLRRLDENSDRVRNAHWKLLSTPASLRAEKAAQLRQELAQLIGAPPEPSAELDPRTHLISATDKFIAYDVMLGVRNGVDAYGQLLIPRNGKRSPVVICQHGFSGQPKDVTGLGESPGAIYHEFARKLAEKGYVTFAPYLTVPRPEGAAINVIVRKAAAIGGMRTGIELAKLRRILDFLTAQPFVDPNRIAYYGLSYGGYSATWMGSMDPRLTSIVISGHFNDWRTKLTNEELATSYLAHPEEDFFNWNVLNRFTHVELIAAMYPRSVMIEYGERDGTTTPEWHEKAWNDVRQYITAWNLDDQVVREAFQGAHEIHAVGSFAFLDRWLRTGQ